MKKLVSVLMLFVIFVQLTPYSFAEDSFSVEHTVINLNEELCNINVVAPYFEGFNNFDEVNRQIENLIANSIGDARATSKSLVKLKCELIENGEEPFDWEVELIVNYDYMRAGDILSLKLSTYYFSGGAHGMSYINPITVNTETGEIYTFKGLFKEDVNLNEVITKQLLNEIEKDPSGYFENYETTIMDKGGEYNYYFDGDKLVIYFDLYDIAPYAAGIPRFTIDIEEIRELLKDEVYNSIKDSEERGSISFNGVDINSTNSILYNDQGIQQIPLRDVAEALGYTVDWNKEDGAIVNGHVVENETVADGVTYVPIQYFTDVLKENVVFETLDSDKLLVKAYGKIGSENQFNNLIAEFEFPATAEEAVTMYAEAVKMRNGAVQYGLLSDELREDKYNEFKELGFVTGTSSPWVDSYEISDIGDNSYQIVFNLKTSVPSDSITVTENVKLIQDGQYWKITSIEEL